MTKYDGVDIIIASQSKYCQKSKIVQSLKNSKDLKDLQRLLIQKNIY